MNVAFMDAFHKPMNINTTTDLGSVWTLKNWIERKKIRKVAFFLVFGLKKLTKKKNMKESYVKKLLEISDKIFLIKL